MIVGLEGEVVKKEPTFLYLKVNGITYKVNISLNCYSLIKDKIISLNITQIIKEDSNSLYGFLDINEQYLFEEVIKINGVGPSTALAICSTFTPQSFSYAVANQDINMIKKVPGIGPKSAKRILVELGDFIIDTNQSQNSLTIAKNEALMALESLGFKKETINRILNRCSSTTTSELVKEALKELGKR